MVVRVNTLHKSDNKYDDNDDDDDTNDDDDNNNNNFLQYPENRGSTKHTLRV